MDGGEDVVHGHVVRRSTLRLVAVAAVSFLFGMVAAVSVTASAQQAEEPPAGSITHDGMHGMMDAMHGEGSSERMHELMGPESGEMMETSIEMMNMMSGMRPMAGTGRMRNGDGMPMMPGMDNGMMGR